MKYFTNRTSRWAQRSLITVFCATSFLTGGALADWPTDVQSPLIIGQSEGFFGDRLSIVEDHEHGIWVSWQDSFYEGSLRLQRVGFDGSLLTPIGIDIQEDPTLANFHHPVLLANGEGVVVSRAGSSVSEHPLQRVGNDGALLWADGFSVDTPVGLALGGAVELAGGDVLVASHRVFSIYLDRVNAAGEQVWDQPTLIEPMSASIRIFSIVPEPTGGAYIFWDSFLSYRKLIFAMRVRADGTLAWESPVRMVHPLPGIASSRHSDPVAVSDGAGGAVLIWTHGHETGTTPAPLRMQRILADGSMSFAPEGVRVSMGTKRQFYVDVQTDEASGDLLIVWNDGQQEEMTLNAQRLTVGGDRLWGDFGLEVSAFDYVLGSFDSIWHDGLLTLAVGGEDGVVMYNLDGQGQAGLGPWTVADEYAGDVRMARSGDGLVVAWQGDGPEFEDYIAVQRVNPDGRLGGAACNIADINGDGELNFFDVSVFLNAFSSGDPVADFTGDGLFNFFDISAFLTAFSAGCP